MSKIVRAIDVGYGNTKYVVSHSSGKEVLCSLFPSISPQASASPDLGSGVFQKRNTVIVSVAGVKYEVGKDAALAQDVSHGRVLDIKFSSSNQYLALLRGAITYMDVPHIDMLVVGLPVNAYKDSEIREKLAERCRGVHRLYSIRGKKEVDVEVRNVRVLPQPLGAFFDYAIRTGKYASMKNERNLLIDPGYYTVDWLLSDGVKTIDARSGAHSGGMSAILRAIAEAIGTEIGSQITEMHKLDKALQAGTNPKFFGKEYELVKVLPIAKSKASEFVDVLAATVGTGSDIDNIILAGGGADFFSDAIKEKFPKHNIIKTKDPVFANVRGFQIAGEEWLAIQKVRQERSAEAS